MTIVYQYSNGHLFFRLRCAACKTLSYKQTSPPKKYYGASLDNMVLPAIHWTDESVQNCSLSASHVLGTNNISQAGSIVKGLSG